VNAAPGLYFGTAGNFEEPSINGRDVAVTNAVMIERS
jgi:hypothetical protein